VQELWLAIQEAPDYEISSCGRVRRCRDGIGSPSGREIKQFPNRLGYKTVYLYANRQRIIRRVHRLVAIAFIPNPESKEDVAHIDGSRDNNHVSNLRWSTHRENMLDKFQHGTMGISKGARNGKSKLTDDAVRDIRSSSESGVELSRRYGVTRSVISDVRRGRIWAHVVCTTP
jgi:hypothetical protein